VNLCIQQMAGEGFDDPLRPCLYRFVGVPPTAIEINGDWFDYLRDQVGIITGFCLWHLVRYAQKSNPNVPNVPQKLVVPESRDLAQAKVFWRLALGDLGAQSCIYSGQIVDGTRFSLDHFLPWRFVAHDLLWNLIPTPTGVNSAKGDSLPDLELYFDAFVQLQYRAVQVVAAHKQARLLEDHLLLLGLGSLSCFETMTADAFRKRLYETIAPQFQIATNMGFSGPWSYA
jgi:hypothetical protein